MKIIVNDRAIELSQEQLDLFGKLKTKLQRNTALKSLEGLSDVDAYVQGGGKAKSENSRSTSASEIMNNPNVQAFLKSFDAYFIAPSVMTRQEMLERLTGVARTSITDVVDINNQVMVEIDGEQVLQSYWSLKDPDQIKGAGASAISELTASKEGIKIKLHDSKAAMKQIADLEGYNAAVRLAVGGDPNGDALIAVTMTPEQYRKARKEALEADDC
jgi:phage terminase small subunit